jgi:hypothetical protein
MVVSPIFSLQHPPKIDKPDCLKFTETVLRVLQSARAWAATMAASAPEHTLRDYLASYVIYSTLQLFEEALNPFVKRCMEEAFPLQCVWQLHLFAFVFPRFFAFVVSCKSFVLVQKTLSLCRYIHRALGGNRGNARVCLLVANQRLRYADFKSEVHHPPRERNPNPNPVILVPVQGGRSRRR